MENPVIELGDDPWSSESLRMDDSVFVYIRGSSPKSSAGEDERFDASRCCRKTIETLCDHLVLQLPAKGLSQKDGWRSDIWRRASTRTATLTSNPRS